jgi:hypothetical protein
LIPSSTNHQDNEFNITMDHSGYTKLTVTRFLEAAVIKKSNMPHVNIISTSFVPNALAKTPEESSQMQEAYNLENISCIGSLIYLYYTIPYTSFAVKNLAKYSRHDIPDSPDKLYQTAHTAKAHLLL